MKIEIETIMSTTIEETVTGILNDSSVKNVSSEEVIQNTNEFSRKTIEELSNRVRVVDQDDTTGLELFCYDKCEPTDDEVIHNCRGVVFHKNKLVMKAFPYTVEYNLSDEDRARFEEKILDDFTKCTFYDAHEGALIRMFYFEGKWYTSTHRKLNAFRSKWASRESFGSAFKKALESEVEHNEELRKSIPDGEANLLERFQSTLDTSKQYMFLVRHTNETRIVCQAPKRPTLYHVGTFVSGELSMSENILIPYPRKHTFLSLNELYDYVDTSDVRDLQGVIVFAPNNRQFKIMQQDYQELFRARGNEPSIKFRYLQVRMNNRQTNMLYHLYPEMAEVMDEYENTIYEIAKSIHSAYVSRFIKKNHVTVSREKFSVIRVCHDWHQLDRVNNRVTLNRVIDVLNQQSPTQINKMIRQFNSGEDQEELGGPVEKNTEQKPGRRSQNREGNRTDRPNTGRPSTQPHKRVLPQAKRATPVV